MLYSDAVLLLTTDNDHISYSIIKLNRICVNYQLSKVRQHWNITKGTYFDSYETYLTTRTHFPFHASQITIKDNISVFHNM